MRHVFDRATERGYTREQIMTALPWCIGSYDKRRRANERNARLAKTDQVCNVTIVGFDFFRL